MALHLVTGYAGKTHITSADQGALHAAIFGRENYILNVGNCFSASAITSNTVKVLDGEVIMQGRHIRLEPGAYEEVTIENGTQEYFRNDLICIRYTKNADTGIENASFVVIKGTPDASSAVDPGYNKGNILDGILTVDLPLYRVPLNGLNIGDLVPLFETKGNIDERIEAVSEDATKLKNGTTPAGNALQLGGKGASEYALAEQIKNNSLWTELTEGFDLNNALGKYRTASTTVVASLINAPDDTYTIYGEVDVVWLPSTANNSYGTQVFIHTYSTVPSIWTRTRQGTTWTEWRKLIDSYYLSKKLADYLLKSSAFATKRSFKNLDFDTIMESGIYEFSGTPAQSGATNYPENTSGVLVVFTGATRMQLYSTYNGNLYYRSKFGDNSYTNYAWSQWKKIFTREGGTITGDISHDVGSNALSHKMVNSNRDIEFFITAAGMFMLYDNTHNKYIINSTVDGDATFYGTATGNLPLSGGGNVTGNVNVSASNYQPITVTNTNSGGASFIKYLNADGVLGFLGFNSANTPTFKNADQTANYDIHHDGNSAKVLVQSTPLTAEGSVRVW